MGFYNNDIQEKELDTGKISLYNSGMAQIRRLDELWVKIHKFAQDGDLTKWNWGLDRIWCELVGDIQENRKDDSDDEKKNNPTERFIFLNSMIGEVKNKLFKRLISIQDSQIGLYNLLMEKEAFLRRLQNRQGKGTKLVNADEDDIE